MKNVHVKTGVLLKTLKDNMQLHIEQYEKAAKEFREAGAIALEKLLEDFKADKTNSLHIALPAPECHKQTYEDAIRMLEMSCDEVVELDEHEAQNLIMNNWVWVGQLGHTRALYSQYLKK